MCGVCMYTYRFCDVSGGIVCDLSPCILQGLAAFLKAIGYLIPLMDNLSANYYTREVMLILIREFQSPDEEMKKIVLKVICNAFMCWSSLPLCLLVCCCFY